MTSINKAPKLPGYHIYHKPKERSATCVSQGMITAVRQGIPHTFRSQNTNDYTEFQILTLHADKNKDHTFINLYTSPRHHTNILELTEPHPSHLVMGDFNAHHSAWGHYTSSTGSTLMNQLIDSHSAVINEPHVPTTVHGSTIDLAISSPDLTQNSHWSQIDDLVSDHIASHILIRNSFVPAPQASILKWNTRRADWVKYSQTLQTLTPDIPPNIDIDIHLDSILEAVQSAADISVPRHTQAKHNRRTNYIPPEGKIYTRQLSMATKAFKRLKTDESRQELRAIQKIAKCELHKLRTKAWDDWCEKLSTMKTNRLWSEISKLRGSTKQVTTRNPKEDADTLAKHFATRAASHTLPLRIQQELRDRHEERSSALQDAIQIESITDRPFSMYELNNALKSLKITTPGKDTFSYEFFIKAPQIFLQKVLELYNSSWHQGTLPAQWKKAKVIPIPKPGGSSYRPISLLQNISKIMEKMVANRLTWLLPTQQNLFGFVRGKSTTDAIAQVIGDITKGKKANGNNRTTVATFLDLDKAFERAQPLAILDSLITLGFKGKILAWLKDYLSNRSIVVALQGFNSNEHPTDTGLPQGSILGPTLFNALIIIILRQTVTLGTKLHAYADDLVLISNEHNPFGRMQQALNRLTEAAESLGLFFSASKTKTMLFYCIPEDIPRFTIGEQPIELVKRHRYLGVIIDDKLHFIHHAKYIKEKLTSRLNILKIISSSKKGVSTAMLLTLYRALIKTVLTYSAPALLMASPSAITQLEIVQRAALRICLGLPRPTPIALVYAEADEPPIKTEIKRSTIKYLIRAATKPHPTPIIQVVQDSLQKDPRVFPPTTWALKAAVIQNDFGIPIIHPPLVHPKPPWLIPPFEVIISRDHIKKDNPVATLNAAISRIKNLTDANTRVWYTDGSQHATGNTGWSAYSHKESPISGRLPQFTPITLTELTALLETLRWCRNNRTLHQRIVINTDSMAALLILQTHTPSTYPETALQVWDEAQHLKQLDIQIIFNWIPSHVGIFGNEEADRLANIATNLDIIQTCEQTVGALGRQIPNRIKTMTDKLYSDYYTTPSGIWYHNTTIPEHKKHPNRFIDTQLRLLRCNCYTKSFNFPDKHIKCNMCQGRYGPIHYLVDCPGLPKIRQNIKQKLLPVQHSLPAIDKANYLLRRSSIIPETIYTLLKRQPYSLQ